MKKVKTKLIFDSTCGKTKDFVLKHNALFVPIIVEIDGKEMESGVNIDSEWFEGKMDSIKSVKTAAARMGDLAEVFHKGLSQADEVLYISISKGLSSTNQNAMQLAMEHEYKGKVHVYDSDFITPWLDINFNQIIKMAEDGMSAKEIMHKLDVFRKTMRGWLVPVNLEWLKKGGRITKVQYLAASLFKIVPIIPAIDGRIDSGVEKVRKMENCYEKIIENALSDYNNNKKLHFCIIGPEKSQHVQNVINKLVNNHNIPANVIHRSLLSAEIVAHTGPDYFGLGTIIKL